VAELIARALAFSSLNEAMRQCTFVASTETIDSYGEIVEQSWKLDRFRSNPVILFGHNSRDLPVGKAVGLDVLGLGTDRRLEVTIQFASEKANPMAEKVWQSVIEGTLRAVSVGFMPGDYRYEKRNGDEVLVFSDNELHEVSVVPIPANPDALAKMRAKARDMSNHADAREGDSMDLEQAKKRIADLEADGRTHEKTVATLTTEKAALEREHAKAAKERDEAKAAVKAAEDKAVELADKLIERDVEDLVGKKITPAEKPEWVELAKSSPTLFKKMAAARPDMKLLDSTVMPDVKGAPPPVTANGAGAALADAINEDAAE
jgi:HK97 family phage prohead protease